MPVGWRALCPVSSCLSQRILRVRCRTCHGTRAGTTSRCACLENLTRRDIEYIYISVDGPKRTYPRGHTHAMWFLQPPNETARVMFGSMEIASHDAGS
jgi:hypothetical protein